MTGTAPDERTYPVMSKITIAEVAMTAARFLKRKSPVILAFLPKKLGGLVWVSFGPPKRLVEFGR